MFVTLRIIFTILSALCVAAAVPLGIIFSWAYCGVCVVGAFLFFIFMRVCKEGQALQEAKANATTPTENKKADFIPSTTTKENRKEK